MAQRSRLSKRRAKPTKDFLNIEAVIVFVENLLAVDTNNEDAMLAHHERTAIQAVAELPDDGLLNSQRTISHPAGDTVLDFDSSHGLPFGSDL